MIKELVLAIILGCLLGFGLTGGFLAIKNSKTAKTTANVPTPIPDNTPSGAVTSPTTIPPDTNSTDTHLITIDSPDNESIVANSQITLKGSTTPQSQLIIVTPVKTYLSTSDDTGNFDIDVEIETGVNLIQVESIDTSDNQASIQLIITYSTAKI